MELSTSCQGNTASELLLFEVPMVCGPMHNPSRVRLGGRKDEKKTHRRYACRTDTEIPDRIIDITFLMNRI